MLDTVKNDQKGGERIRPRVQRKWTYRQRYRQKLNAFTNSN
nr:MAG TPA: hypothetical protein [Caudoviricetes sp.]